MSRFRNRRMAARLGLAFTAWMLGAGALLPAYAQYVGRINPNKSANTPTLRATAVLEYTGELTKPTASRLVPVSVWDGERYQPGGLYMAQPMPLAVESGTQYELEEAGIPRGLFNVKAAADVSGSWIAIGGYQSLATPKVTRLKPSKIPPQVVRDAGADDDRPHFAHRPADSGSGAGNGSGNGAGNAPGNSSGTAPASGSTSGSGSGSGQTASNVPAVDPDRPTLHRRTDAGGSSGDTSAQGGAGSSGSSGSGSSGSGSGTTSTGSNSAGGSGSGGSTTAGASADPERPTLHRHGAANPNDNGAPVSATMDIDPDRPRLMRGRPETLERIDDPDKVISAQGAKLQGSTVQMKQIVAVSDVSTREPHSFVYSWSNPEDAKKAQAAMELIAQQLIAGKPGQPIGQTPSSSAPAAHPRTATAAHRAAKPAAPALPELTDEQFKAYELSFGGGATLVFSARTVGTGDQVKYVTLIAQPDFDGNPQVILKQVTSEGELDVTPRMLLVDASDTDADNRAELIFELAGKSDHQYAIYRVADRSVTQVFTTGPVG